MPNEHEWVQLTGASTGTRTPVEPAAVGALARGEELGAAVRYAVAAAALSTTGPGARGALPDDDDVRALLPRLPDAIPVD